MSAKQIVPLLTMKPQPTTKYKSSTICTDTIPLPSFGSRHTSLLLCRKVIKVVAIAMVSQMGKGKGCSKSVWLSSPWATSSQWGNAIGTRPYMERSKGIKPSKGGYSKGAKGKASKSKGPPKSHLKAKGKGTKARAKGAGRIGSHQGTTPLASCADAPWRMKAGPLERRAVPKAKAAVVTLSANTEPKPKIVKNRDAIKKVRIKKNPNGALNHKIWRAAKLLIGKNALSKMATKDKLYKLGKDKKKWEKEENVMVPLQEVPAIALKVEEMTERATKIMAHMKNRLPCLDVPLDAIKKSDVRFQEVATKEAIYAMDNAQVPGDFDFAKLAKKGMKDKKDKKELPNGLAQAVSSSSNKKARPGKRNRDKIKKQIEIEKQQLAAKGIAAENPLAPTPPSISSNKEEEDTTMKDVNAEAVKKEDGKERVRNHVDMGDGDYSYSSSSSSSSSPILPAALRKKVLETINNLKEDIIKAPEKVGVGRLQADTKKLMDVIQMAKEKDL